MTGVTFHSLLVFAAALTRAFAVIRPIFRERGKLMADVTGRLTESLGGVRVVKGYRAEPREEAVFSAGITRVLANGSGIDTTFGPKDGEGEATGYHVFNYASINDNQRNGCTTTPYVFVSPSA